MTRIRSRQRERAAYEDYAHEADRRSRLEKNKRGMVGWADGSLHVTQRPSPL